MKKKITIAQLEHIIVKMRKLQEEHPMAKVFYDTEDNGVQVIYPLPPDYYVKYKQFKKQ